MRKSTEKRISDILPSENVFAQSIPIYQDDSQNSNTLQVIIAEKTKQKRRNETREKPSGPIHRVQ